jgi:SAM-dependent methyltransferase
MISRDLLDSVAEIYALESRVGLLSKRQWRILDIGAGYGRLAHRMIEAGVSLESYLCLDGVPLSTEICRFYLAARRVPSVVRSVSLMEIDFDNPPRADLAVAIHSLSEMPIAAVSAWVALVARSGADYLAVVPNDPERIQSTEPDGRHESLERVIAASGFTLQSDAQVVEGRGAWFAPSDHKGVPDRLLLYQRS